MTWYCLKTAPQKEFEAQRILIRIGYQARLPVERHWRRGAGGQRKLREVALMSRYLFVKSAALDLYRLRNLHCRNGLPIITGYIAKEDGRPYPLPEEIVLRLMSLVTPHSAAYHKSLKVGDTVNLPQGMTGRIHGTKGAQAEVLTELLGKQHMVRIAIEKLEAA